MRRLLHRRLLLVCGLVTVLLVTLWIHQVATRRQPAPVDDQLAADKSEGTGSSRPRARATIAEGRQRKAQELSRQYAGLTDARGRVEWLRSQQAVDPDSLGQALVTAMRDPDPRVREAAVEIIPDLDAPYRVAPYQAALRSGDAKLREDVFDTLYAEDDDVAINTLAVVREPGTPAAVALESIDFLATMNRKTAAEILAELLSHPSDQVSAAAWKALCDSLPDMVEAGVRGPQEFPAWMAEHWPEYDEELNYSE